MSLFCIMPILIVGNDYGIVTTYIVHANIYILILFTGSGELNCTILNLPYLGCQLGYVVAVIVVYSPTLYFKGEYDLYEFLFVVLHQYFILLLWI